MVDTVSGVVVAHAQYVMLCGGEGRLKGRRGRCETIKPLVLPPDRPPDATRVEATCVNQAVLFRQCGDLNPLHVDERFAREMGFQRPILHGLCCYGYALRHVMDTYGDGGYAGGGVGDGGDSGGGCGGGGVSLFKSMKVQFSNPVYPGDTLLTEMWCEGNRVVFQMKVKERGEFVLKGGSVRLNG